MSALKDVMRYMEFWGWTDGGNPGSVKKDDHGKIIGHHGDATWIADVDRACATLQRLADRVSSR